MILSKTEFLQQFMLNRARAIEESLAHTSIEHTSYARADPDCVAKWEMDFAEEVWKRIEKADPKVFNHAQPL